MFATDAWSPLVSLRPTAVAERHSFLLMDASIACSHGLGAASPRTRVLDELNHVGHLRHWQGVNMSLEFMRRFKC